MALYKNILRRFGKYELTSFTTGFVLLSFELVASRLLAPSVGTSTYVWTSVIGVIIAALALGFAVGGWLADSRAKQTDLPYLLLLVAISIGWTASLSSPTLELLQTITDARLRAITASVLLFMPTSFLIGVTSPYLARLRNQSVTTTGRSVALLDASNSIGGIIGTFLTGFYLVGFVGLRITLAMLTIITIAISWLLVSRLNFKTRLLLTGLALLFCLTPQTVLDRTVTAEIDTPTAHYQIRSVTYNDQAVTAISTGPSGLQSGVSSSGSKELVFNYTRLIARLAEEAPAKSRILIIGGGTFTLPEYLARTYPDSTVDTVEIDPRLPDIARYYFYFEQPRNLTIISEDARVYLNKSHEPYDIIILDAYNDTSIPYSLVTEEFIHKLRLASSPQATVLANIIASEDRSCLPLFNTFNSLYTSQFPNARYYPMTGNFTARQNIIAVYSKASLQWAQHSTQPTKLQAVAIPTDDKAPIEQLTEQCAR